MKTIKLNDYAHIPYEFSDILLFLKAKGLLDNLVICGSMGLVLNHKLHRQVADLDFIEIESKYGTNIGNLAANYKTEQTSSCKFNVGNKIILCWKINIFNTKVEFLSDSTNSKINYEEIEIITNDGFSIIVKVEEPEAAIKFKKAYVNCVTLTKGRDKHISDLKILETNFTYVVPISNIIDYLPF